MIIALMSSPRIEHFKEKYWIQFFRKIKTLKIKFNTIFFGILKRIFIDYKEYSFLSETGAVLKYVEVVPR